MYNTPRGYSDLLSSKGSPMSRVTIEIDGMSCQHCVNAVSKALSTVPGAKVEGVSIGSADVSYDDSKADIEALLDAVADAGYSGSPKA